MTSIFVIPLIDIVFFVKLRTHVARSHLEYSKCHKKERVKQTLSRVLYHVRDAHVYGGGLGAKPLRHGVRARGRAPDRCPDAQATQEQDPTHTHLRYIAVRLSIVLPPFAHTGWPFPSTPPCCSTRFPAHPPIQELRVCHRCGHMRQA